MAIEYKVLPCYYHLVDPNDFDIEFLYGGRDSGKSRHIAQQLILDCLSLPYFRCVLTRKVKDTIKDSQWQLIKDIVEEYGLDCYFTFNKSPLEINCTNGNKFICRGLDEPTKIKSVSNPSHCWVEEGNQIDNEDFVTILTTLRYNQGNVKTYFSFNPECETNYTEFWLYQEWFSHTSQLSWEWIKSIDVDGEVINYKARATHTTYKDNPYCKPQRKALYESYKTSKNNAYWYQTYTLGLWGFKRTGGEFWKCFDESLHVKDIRYTPGFPIHVYADNNANPYIAVAMWQMDHEHKKLKQVYELPCEHPNNTASKAGKRVVNWLDSVKYEGIVNVGGDATAKKKSTEDDDGKSFFDKFIGVIIAAGYKVANRVQTVNPSVSLSGDFVNEIYESNYAGWAIEISSDCRKSIEDYTMTKEDAEGGVLKKNELDKETKVSFQRYGHFTDVKRYYATTVLKSEFEAYKSRHKRRRMIEV